jgi:hypothetical protein
MNLLSRAGKISDVHTLTVAIRVLRQVRAEPRLIEALQDLLVRLEDTLGVTKPSDTAPKAAE